MGYGKGETIRVGIIGCGGIANGKHMPSIARLKNIGIEMVAFCDIVEQRAIDAAKKFGTPDAKVYTDYKELLADPTIDDVHVCTPNRSHSFITVDAIEAGKNVMCEKPMAMNYEEAKKMLDAKNRTGKSLTIGYQNRQTPEHRYLRDQVEKGRFGDIYYAKATAIRRRAVPTWGVFMNEYEQGGGPLIDIGTHSLDLTLWILNNYKPKYCVGTVYHKLADLPADMRGNAWGNWEPEEFTVEDSAFGFIVMENGATINLEASWALNTLDVREATLSFCGTKAGADEMSGIRINGVEDGRPYVNRIEMSGGGVAFNDAVGDEDDSVREQRVWYNYLRGEGELFVKPEQAIVVTQILEGIYESAKSGTAYFFKD